MVFSCVVNSRMLYHWATGDPHNNFLFILIQRSKSCHFNRGDRGDQLGSNVLILSNSLGQINKSVDWIFKDLAPNALPKKPWAFGTWPNARFSMKIWNFFAFSVFCTSRCSGRTNSLGQRSCMCRSGASWTRKRRRTLKPEAWGQEKEQAVRRANCHKRSQSRAGS